MRQVLPGVSVTGAWYRARHVRRRAADQHAPDRRRLTRRSRHRARSTARRSTDLQPEAEPSRGSWICSIRRPPIARSRGVGYNGLELSFAARLPRGGEPVRRMVGRQARHGGVRQQRSEHVPLLRPECAGHSVPARLQVRRQLPSAARHASRRIAPELRGAAAHGELGCARESLPGRQDAGRHDTARGARNPSIWSAGTSSI